MRTPKAWEFEMNLGNAKVFAAAVQALSMVGKEVTFAVEPTKSKEGALIISAMPEAQAAFGQVRFEAQCFTKSRVKKNLDARRLGCKVVARTLLPALRRATRGSQTSGVGVSGVYKVILRHDLEQERKKRRRSGSDDSNLSDDDDSDDSSDNASHGGGPEEDGSPRLTIEIWHEDGVKRRWRLFYEAAEADFVPEFDERSVGDIVAQPAQFLGVFEHVGAAGLDVRISAHDGIDVASRDDDDLSNKGAIRGTGRASTTLRIDINDLDKCDMPPQDDDDDDDDDDEEPPADVQLSFHAKEVKAFVKFCEHASVHHLRFRFSKPGRPIALDADSPSGATIHFLISTSATAPKPDAFASMAYVTDPAATNRVEKSQS